MADSAALLVDEILPHKPMRQWVLRVPFPFLTELTNVGHELRLVPDEAKRIGQRQRHSGFDPESVLTLCQREEIPDRVRDVFGASASPFWAGFFFAETNYTQ